MKKKEIREEIKNIRTELKNVKIVADETYENYKVEKRATAYYEKLGEEYKQKYQLHKDLKEQAYNYYRDLKEWLCIYNAQIETLKQRLTRKEAHIPYAMKNNPEAFNEALDNSFMDDFDYQPCII